MKGRQRHDYTSNVITHFTLSHVCMLLLWHTVRCRTSCVPAPRPQCTQSCPGICGTSATGISHSHDFTNSATLARQACAEQATGGNDAWRPRTQSRTRELAALLYTLSRRATVSEGCRHSPLAGVDQGTIRKRRIGDDECVSQAREHLGQLAGWRRELQRNRGAVN